MGALNGMFEADFLPFRPFCSMNDETFTFFNYVGLKDAYIENRLLANGFLL